MRKPKRNHSAAFMARVALEAFRGEKTIAQIAAHHEVRPNQVTTWKSQALEGLVRIFGGTRIADDGREQIWQLREKGWRADPVTTLMRRMGIEAIWRKPRNSLPARGSLISPYLLSGLVIDRPHQVWTSDITYRPMAHGFQYLVAMPDVASRKVLAWRLSNTLTAD